MHAPDRLPTPPEPLRLPVASLFLVGPDGDGASMIQDWVRRLAVPLVDQFELAAETSITIADVRQFLHQMQLKPVDGIVRLGLIPEAHRLTPEAANALLKTLEDPPPHARFLLAAPHEEQLPGTMISRCQRWRVKLGGRRETADENAWDIVELRKQSYHERLQRAESWAKDKNFLDEFNRLIQAARPVFLAGGLTTHQVEELLGLRAMADTNVSRRLLAEVTLLVLGKESV